MGALEEEEIALFLQRMLWIVTISTLNSFRNVHREAIIAVKGMDPR